ncbi:MAG: relaxase/mobilization nuclease domain-containing protein [Paludibacter sp.]|nr:relaxase/mobilization nuclease domain-containing protein [Paludibacter sp.]
MIGLSKSCNGGGALANYVLNENKGYELDRNLLCGSTPKEIVEEMKVIQDLNQRATNKTFSLVLSPDIKDSQKLTNKELKEIAQDYLTRLGIDPVKQQYVAFVHTEKQHKHIHIIASRVQPNGKLISDHHIGKRGQWIAHEIAKERGLVSAKEKMFENIKNIDQKKGDFKNLKTEIFRKHQSIVRANPNTLSNYIKAMDKNGLEIKPTINKQGQIQGFRVIDKGTKTDHKMSDINSSMSGSNLIKNGLKNDLGIPLDKTLQAVEDRQIHKLKTKTSELNTSLLKPLKTASKGLKPSLKNFNFSERKEIKTKEDYLHAIKEYKFIEEVVKPVSIINMDFIEARRQAGILKDYESKKELEKIEDSEKSEKEIKSNQNNLEI